MYRRPHRRPKSEVLNAVPLFRREQIDTTMPMFVLLLDKLGVTDFPNNLRPTPTV